MPRFRAIPSLPQVLRCKAITIPMNVTHQIDERGQGMLSARLRQRLDTTTPQVTAAILFYVSGLLVVTLAQIGLVGFKMDWGDFWVIAGVIAGAVFFAATVLTNLSGRRFVAGEHCIIVVGWAVITFGVASSGGLDSPHSSYFVYPMLYSAYFLTPRAAALQVTLGVLCSLAPFVYATDGIDETGVQTLTVQMVVFVALSVMITARRHALRKVENDARRLALSDPLTGVANLRAVQDFGEALVHKHLAAGTTFGLVVADLDGLKRVNTAFGHTGGDDLIIRFSECLRAASEPDDQVGRTGGDEFVVLLPAATEAELNAWAERFSSVVRAHNEGSAGSRPQVAACFGSAIFPADGETLDALIGVADQRMYAQKATAGRYTAALQSQETSGGRELRTESAPRADRKRNESTALAAAAAGWLVAAAILLTSILIPSAQIGEPSLVLALCAFCGTIGLISWAGRYAMTRVAIEVGKWATVIVVPAAALITGGAGSPLLPAVVFMTAYAAYFMPERVAAVQISMTLTVFSVAFWASGGVSDIEETRFLNVIVTSLIVAFVLQYDARRIADENAVVVQMALTDPLTGIANRRAFETDLHAVIETHSGATANDLRPSLIFFDLDDFKAVNTSLGHGGGDALLRSAAMRLRDAIAEDGQIYRVGGDEFAVITPIRIADDAALLSERCRIAVHGAGQDVGLPVTASFGYAVWRESCDLQELVVEADFALARSKDGGKNTVSESRLTQSFDSAEMHGVRLASASSSNL